jgi:hypothetical protein
MSQMVKKRMRCPDDLNAEKEYVRPAWVKNRKMGLLNVELVRINLTNEYQK